MSNFWARTITGLSMVFILLAAIWFSGWVFAAIFLLILILGLVEFYGLITGTACSPQKSYGIAAGVILYLFSTLFFFRSPLIPQSPVTPLLPFLLPIPLFFISLILEIYRNKNNPLTNVATTTFGYLYIALPFSLLNAFSAPDSLHFYRLPVILTGYFAFTWIYDTGAYLYGKQFGKHQFFKRISPKKTWEGTIAGAIITYAFATGLSLWITTLPVWDWFVLATLVVLFGTHGDLFESLVKRSLDIKDSGKILPGHGGILDRFDTVLLSSPFVFLYFFFRNII